MYIRPINTTNYYNNTAYRGYNYNLKMKEHIPVSLNPVKNLTNMLLKKTSILSQRFQCEADAAIKRYITRVMLPHDVSNNATAAWDINKGNSKKYIIVFHGICHNITRLQDLYKGIIDKTDYAVLAPEYSDICYPHNNRKTFSEKTIIDDTRASINYLEKKGIKKEDITVAGHSFGGYVASMLGKEFSDIERLILISPTNSFKQSLCSLENKNTPLIPKRMQFLIENSNYARNQLAHVYDTQQVLSQVRCPVDIIYASHDKMVTRDTVEKLASVSQKLSGLHFLKEGAHRMDNSKIDAVVAILNGEK